MEASLDLQVEDLLLGRPRAFLPCSCSSQIPVGWCVRGSEHTCFPPTPPRPALLPVTHELRPHCLTTADLVTSMVPQAASRAEAPALMSHTSG